MAEWDFIRTFTTRKCQYIKNSDMINFLFHLITAYIVPGMVAGFDVCFFFLTIPDCQALKKYILARRIMGCTYFVYCAALIAEVVTRQSTVHPMLEKFIILMISCTQAFFFSYTLITLIDIHFLTIRKVCREIIAILCAVVFSMVSFAFCQDKMLNVVFYVLSAFYLLLITRYVLVFRRYYKAYRQNTDNYFSDDELHRLHWVATAFYSATLIGLLAFAYAWIPLPIVSLLFMTTANIYYAIFGVRFLNYVYVFPTIEPVITEPIVTVSEDYNDSSTEPTPSNSDLQFMETLDQLMESKRLYANSSLSIENLAVLTGKNHRVVSAIINRCRRVNFKTYTNEFRVKDASRLIDSGWLSQHTMDALAEETGFGNRTNLYRVFKRHTGASPSEKKEKKD